MSEIKKDFLQGRTLKATDPEFTIKVNGKNVSFNYFSKTWRSMFDISDVNGRILKRGEIAQEQSEYQLNLSDFKSGNYVLWIVDGADLLKMNFLLAD